jgi:hypothetical protein
MVKDWGRERGGGVTDRVDVGRVNVLGPHHALDRGRVAQVDEAVAQQRV